MPNPGLTNLKAWWKMDEITGTRFDEQGNVDLTATGAIWGMTGRNGFAGRAAEFIGSNNEYLINTTSTLVQIGPNHATFGFWIYPYEMSSYPDLFTKYGATNAQQEYIIRIDTNSKILFAVRDTNDDWYVVTAKAFGTLSHKTWYFVCGYFDPDANKIGIGVNDVWDTVSVGTYGIQQTTADFLIARRDGFGGVSYTGLMEDAFFYQNQEVTAAQRTWLYHGGQGRRYEDVAQVAPPSVDVITKRRMPEIYVYDEDLASIGIIEEYSSLNWAERYNSEGDFELELPLSYAASPLIAFGNFLYIPTSDKLMIVEEKKPTKTPTEGKLLVNGRSAESILRRRILTQIHNWIGPAEYYAYHLIYWSMLNPVDPDRELPLLEDGSGDTWPPAMEQSYLVSAQFKDEKIYEAIEAVLKIANLGFKITVADFRTNPKLYFFVYKGVDRSSTIIFSDSFDNLLDSSFLVTQKDKINVIHVVTEDAIYEKMFVWEGGSDENPGGTKPSELNRFEGRLETDIDRGDVAAVSTPAPSTKPSLGVVGKVSLDAVGITTTPVMELKTEPPVFLSDEEVLAIIEERGETVIKDNTLVTIFDGDVDTRTQFIIGEDFFLGDIVQVRTHGNDSKARIIEVVKSYSVEGEKIYIAFDFEV